MPSLTPTSTRTWDIGVENQEELAWFRDNLARVLVLLGQGELQSHLFAAQVAQAGYDALKVRADVETKRKGNASQLSLRAQSSNSDRLPGLHFCISFINESRRRQIRVDAKLDAELWIALPRVSQWALGSQPAAALNQSYDKVDQQFARKCRSQLNREMRAQNQELLRRLEAVNVAERAAEVKSAFLASMSHELRTPMNSILGFTRRLRRRLDGKIDDRDLQALDVVTRNGNHLLSMINDILDFSKLEAEQEGLDLAHVSLSEVVQAVLIQFDPLLGDGQQLLLRDCTPAEFQLFADSGKIGQILTNLVSNAVKYGGCGDIELLLERTTCPELGAIVSISVTDRGKGMSAEEQAKVFSPFSRLDNDATRAASGTGLGLAIASRYAKMHSGHLRVTSVLGQGTTFCLQIPEDLDERQALATEASAA